MSANPCGSLDFKKNNSTSPLSLLKNLSKKALNLSRSPESLRAFVKSSTVIKEYSGFHITIVVTAEGGLLKFAIYELYSFNAPS